MPANEIIAVENFRSMIKTEGECPRMPQAKCLLLHPSSQQKKPLLQHNAINK